LREVVAASGAARRMAARRGSELARRGAPGQRARDAGAGSAAACAGRRCRAGRALQRGRERRRAERTWRRERREIGEGIVEAGGGGCWKTRDRARVLGLGDGPLVGRLG
jgi:hypothetical protein